MATDFTSTAQSPLEPPQHDTPPVPQVSIGMPVYNGELFIREALDSLLAQTFTDFELIISDNASTDATEAICLEFAEKDKRIRYVRHPKNRGPMPNFQFVLDEAVGEYFMWAAADDTQSSDFIEVLSGVLNSSSHIICAMSDVLNVHELNREENFVSSLDDIRFCDVKRDWKKVRKRFFRNPTSNIFFCVYGLFKTNYLRQIDLCWKGIRKYAFSSEVPVMAQASLLGSIASVSLPLKCYRRSSSSLYHKERKVLTTRDQVSGFLSISVALIDIILSSNLKLFEKIELVEVVAVTTGRGLLGQASNVLRKKIYLFLPLNFKSRQKDAF